MQPQKSSLKGFAPSERTCLEVALERLEERAIRDSTYRSYLQTIRVLGLEELPYEKATVRLISQKLQGVLTESTRRKHATNIKACLGLKVPTVRVKQKAYDLPAVQEVYEAFKESPYRIYAFTMLYAGARIGEAVIKQPIRGNVITFDRQRTPQNEILPPKSSGPVIVPDWFAEEYRQAEDFNKHHATVYAGIKRRAKRMLGTHLNPHQLRHLFATSHVDMGASPRVLQAQMRHSDVKISLQYYVHTRQQDIADFMNRFDRG